MKQRLLAVICTVLLLTTAACAQSSPGSSVANDNSTMESNATDQSPETSNAISLTVPAGFYMIDLFTDSMYIENNNINSSTENEDGSVTINLDKDVCEELASQHYDRNIEQFQRYVDEESYIEDISYNEDFSEITITIITSGYGNAPLDTVVSVGLRAMYYQIYSCMDLNSVVTVIDSTTGEEIDTVPFPQYFFEMNDSLEAFEEALSKLQ